MRVKRLRRHLRLLLRPEGLRERGLRHQLLAKLWGQSVRSRRLRWVLRRVWRPGRLRRDRAVRLRSELRGDAVWLERLWGRLWRLSSWERLRCRPMRVRVHARVRREGLRGGRVRR